jgi:pyruvate dehydrogenase E2 component (dihydrolipoamide acetyltransferase)
MEALSPTMEEGRLVEWKKQEGDSVQAGDVLAEVETDKAVMELVARVAGTLLKQAAPAGATIPVSALVGWIGQPGESIEDGGAPKASAPPPAPQSAPAASQTTPRAAAAAVTPPAPAAEEAPSKSEPAPAPPTGRVKASPLARRIASERGVDLRQIAGSGPEGRVVKRDVDAAPARTAPSAPAPRVAAAAPGAAYQDVPLTQIRKTIAKRLVQSIGPIPTFYLTTEIDMERVAEAREALLAAGAKNAPDTPKISFNDIVIKAVALALRQHPACNAWWQDDRIRVWNEVHVGMAVAVEEGLITPVIRHADQLSLREISAEAKALAGRARERKLTPGSTPARPSRSRISACSTSSTSPPSSIRPKQGF